MKFAITDGMETALCDDRYATQDEALAAAKEYAEDNPDTEVTVVQLLLVVCSKVITDVKSVE